MLRLFFFTSHFFLREAEQDAAITHVPISKPPPPPSRHAVPFPWRQNARERKSRLFIYHSIFNPKQSSGKSSQGTETGLSFLATLLKYFTRATSSAFFLIFILVYFIFSLSCLLCCTRKKKSMSNPLPFHSSSLRISFPVGADCEAKQVTFSSLPVPEGRLNNAGNTDQSSGGEVESPASAAWCWWRRAVNKELL